MPAELVINVDPQVKRSPSSVAPMSRPKGLNALSHHGSGIFLQLVGHRRHQPYYSSAMVAASTPNLIDATKEFDFKLFQVQPPSVVGQLSKEQFLVGKTFSSNSMARHGTFGRQMATPVRPNFGNKNPDRADTTENEVQERQ